MPVGTIGQQQKWKLTNNTRASESYPASKLHYHSHHLIRNHMDYVLDWSKTVSLTAVPTRFPNMSNSKAYTAWRKTMWTWERFGDETDKTFKTLLRLWLKTFPIDLQSIVAGFHHHFCHAFDGTLNVLVSTVQKYCGRSLRTPLQKQTDFRLTVIEYRSINVFWYTNGDATYLWGWMQGGNYSCLISFCPVHNVGHWPRGWIGGFHVHTFKCTCAYENELQLWIKGPYLILATVLSTINWRRSLYNLVTAIRFESNLARCLFHRQKAHLSPVNATIQVICSAKNMFNTFKAKLRIEVICATNTKIPKSRIHSSVHSRYCLSQIGNGVPSQFFPVRRCHKTTRAHMWYSWGMESFRLQYIESQKSCQHRHLEYLVHRKSVPSTSRAVQN